MMSKQILTFVLSILLLLNASATLVAQGTTPVQERFNVLPNSGARPKPGSQVRLNSQVYQLEPGIEYIAIGSNKPSPKVWDKVLTVQPLPSTKNLSWVTRDILNKPAGGQIPVVNYHRRMVEPSSCYDQYPHRDQFSIVFDDKYYKEYVFLMPYLYYGLDCPTQAAVDVATALFSLSSLHYFPKDQAALAANARFRREYQDLIDFSIKESDKWASYYTFPIGLQMLLNEYTESPIFAIVKAHKDQPYMPNFYINEKYTNFF